jgi:hypothetical protein
MQAECIAVTSLTREMPTICSVVLIDLALYAMAMMIIVATSMKPQVTSRKLRKPLSQGLSLAAIAREALWVMMITKMMTRAVSGRL